MIFPKTRPDATSVAGFSLAEVLLVTAVLGVFVWLASQTLLRSQRTAEEERQRSLVQEQVEVLAGRLSRDFERQSIRPESLRLTPLPGVFLNQGPPTSQCFTLAIDQSAVGTSGTYDSTRTITYQTQCSGEQMEAELLEVLATGVALSASCKNAPKVVRTEGGQQNNAGSETVFPPESGAGFGTTLCIRPNKWPDFSELNAEIGGIYLIGKTPRFIRRSLSLQKQPFGSGVEILAPN